MAAVRTIHFILNGTPVSAQVTPDDNIVDMLSQQFDLRGARESCGQGLCGCCTVYLNSKAVSGCLSFAWFLDGATVQTIEGLGTERELDPIQEAFVEAGAFQCGFCTPGFIMMAKQLLDTDPNPSDDDIRHYMAGNLCRCSAYPEIIDAIKLAAARRARE